MNARSFLFFVVLTSACQKPSHRLADHVQLFCDALETDLGLARDKVARGLDDDGPPFGKIGPVTSLVLYRDALLCAEAHGAVDEMTRFGVITAGQKQAQIVGVLDAMVASMKSINSHRLVE